MTFRTPISGTQINDMRKAYLAGEGQTDIALKMGVSRTTVKKFTEGITPNPAPDTAIHHGDWEDEAACINTDPELFFPEPGNHHAIKDAVGICRACPVRTPCIEKAIRTKSVGIWGGIYLGRRATRGAFDSDEKQVMLAGQKNNDPDRRRNANRGLTQPTRGNRAGRGSS